MYVDLSLLLSLFIIYFIHFLVEGLNLNDRLTPPDITLFYTD